jgi:universal stress protein E
MHRFKNILYFADGALESCAALQRAVNLARRNNARLSVLDVLPAAETPADFQQRLGINLDSVLRERRQEQLEALVSEFQEPDSLIYTRVLTGNAFVEVIHSVLRNGYDLLIKAAKPPQGLSERLLGSSDLHLLRKCPCPVWIDRPSAAMPYHSVLVAVDPVATKDKGVNRLAMDLAVSLAERESAALHIVHAWRLYGESILRNGRARISNTELDMLLAQTRQQHEDCLNALLSAYNLNTAHTQVHLEQGEPALSIQSVAKRVNADLIVMGTLGRSGVPGLFIGNTAEDVLQDAQSSILAVKPEGFVSPVSAL